MMVSAIIEMGADIINVFATSIFPSFIIKIYSLVFIMLLPYPFVRALLPYHFPSIVLQNLPSNFYYYYPPDSSTTPSRICCLGQMRYF